MQNISYTVQGDELVIRVNLKVGGSPSASGKSLVLASTHGNMPVHDAPVGTMMGLNIYTKR